ncbi:hypothetical protein [Haloterrigena turkmenica]|uniref:hypothetical protein n=1 Tax=Haloterrigena turkmenica TaxID=62320 RepID=UPI001650DFF5|nr:hypothetical protein [Haloterrigena turkmenica]
MVLLDDLRVDVFPVIAARDRSRFPSRRDRNPGPIPIIIVADADEGLRTEVDRCGIDVRRRVPVIENVGYRLHVAFERWRDTEDVATVFCLVVTVLLECLNNVRGVNDDGFDTVRYSSRLGASHSVGDPYSPDS